MYKTSEFIKHDPRRITSQLILIKVMRRISVHKGTGRIRNIDQLISYGELWSATVFRLLFSYESALNIPSDLPVCQFWSRFISWCLFPVHWRNFENSTLKSIQNNSRHLTISKERQIGRNRLESQNVNLEKIYHFIAFYIIGDIIFIIWTFFCKQSI